MRRTLQLIAFLPSVRALRLAVALLAFGAFARADEDNNGGMPRHWVTLNGDGLTVLIDLNSVDTFGADKLATVCIVGPGGLMDISKCRRYLFDCQGHYLDFNARMSAPWIDAPPQKITGRLAKLA